jgi:hypothetical protein
MARVVAISWLAIGCVAACSYDWNVAAPHDAGADTNAPLDASVDASSDSTVQADSPLDSPAQDTAPLSCDQLAANARAAKPAAKACGMPLNQACQAAVTDECRCDQIVGNFDPSAVQAYSDALKAFFDANCPKPAYCVACTSATRGLCVVDNPDAGTLHCNQ